VTVRRSDGGLGALLDLEYLARIAEPGPVQSGGWTLTYAARTDDHRRTAH